MTRTPQALPVQTRPARLVPEVSYFRRMRARRGSNGAGRYNPRLDLVLFRQRIPPPTLEAEKRVSKQSVENAKRQYRQRTAPGERPAFTRKPEPLLPSNAGALGALLPYCQNPRWRLGHQAARVKTPSSCRSTSASSEGGAGNPMPEDG